MRIANAFCAFWPCTAVPPALDYEHPLKVLWSAASTCLAQELPSEGLRDWSSVVPSGFASLWRRRTAKDPPPATPTTVPAAAGKKAGSGSKASAAPGTAEPVAAAAAAAAAAGSGAADAQLKLTAELAVASSLLSYPLTLLHCLGVPGASAVQEPTAGSVPPGGSGAGPSKGRGEGRVGAAAAAGAAASASASALGAVRERLTDRAAAAGAPLVVCVLGASETAELAQPRVWRVRVGAGVGACRVNFRVLAGAKAGRAKAGRTKAGRAEAGRAKAGRDVQGLGRGGNGGNA